MPELSRKQFVGSLLAAAAAAALPGRSEAAGRLDADAITLDDLKAMERIAGISFTDNERRQILSSVSDNRNGYASIRKQPIGFTTEPRTVFTPLGGGSVPGARVSARPTGGAIRVRPVHDEDVAFLSVRDLGSLIRTKQISSVELTSIYLKRLQRYGPALRCLITPMEERAMAQAKRADEEIAQGRYRGPLHGVPYGIKDLFATKGVPTTWGAEPYENQVFDFDAAVVERLEAAGAVILGKLSMGALAMNDHWFKGQTLNPWNPRQGSSGSSAGSASSTAAGLVGFSIGTETLGSIVSPSIRCRVTGLRPTYGRVSRFGGMALSYTMDKVGPICRSAEDCALVLAAICGADPRDPSAVDRPFSWPRRVDFHRLKIGWLVGPNVKSPTVPPDDQVVAVLRARGATVEPISFSPVPEGVGGVLDVEAASAFDSFTRGPEIHELLNSQWPQTFRTARYVPAVEYLQMQRARTLLMSAFEREFGDFDAYVTQGGGYTLTHTNLTGHPQIAVPLKDGQARSLVGRLYREDVLASIASGVQQELGYTKLRPDLTVLGA